MLKIIKHFLKFFTLFIAGGLIYCLIEIIYRGRTHWTSFIMGGVALCMAGALNEIRCFDMSLIIQMTTSGIIITIMEFFVGIYFNSDYSIWDYRDMPFNVDGQVCLGFSLIWCLLSLVAIILDDFIRWKFFNEEKPEYKI